MNSLAKRKETGSDHLGGLFLFLPSCCHGSALLNPNPSSRRCPVLPYTLFRSPPVRWTSDSGGGGAGMENHKRNVPRLRVRVTAKKRGKEPESSAGSSKKPRERECVNSVTKLQRREIGGFPRIARGTSSNAPEKFRNIQLQVRLP